MGSNFFWSDIFVNPIFFSDSRLLSDPKNLWTSKFFGPHFFWTQHFFKVKHFFLTQNFGDPKFFWPKILLDTKIFTQNLFRPKMHLRMEFDSGVGPTCFIYFPLFDWPLLVSIDDLEHRKIWDILSIDTQTDKRTCLYIYTTIWLKTADI